MVKQEYNDNWIERFLIWLFSSKISSALGTTMTKTGYDGLVEVSTKIMNNRNPEEQKTVVISLLLSLFPLNSLEIIRSLIVPTKIICELNAWFTTRLCVWLVGPCEVQEVEILSRDGTLSTQKSCVYIPKCRYLENSRCVGTCTNLCKVPTQEFFTNHFGLPLTMNPNFEDLSCKLIFGQSPPPMEDDPVYGQPCLTATLSKASCPKIRV